MPQAVVSPEGDERGMVSRLSDVPKLPRRLLLGWKATIQLSATDQQITRKTQDLMLGGLLCLWVLPTSVMLFS